MAFAPSPLSDPLFALAQVPDEQVDLARGALLIARDAYPRLDLDAYLARLEGMASALRPRCADAPSLEARLRLLNHYLFAEQGFRGSAPENYYDPRNSYLNEVLDRRQGIPITLSVVYLSVGRQLELSLEGVNFPGHFLVRGAGPAAPLFIDPFAGGRLLSRGDLEELLSRAQGERLPLDERFLQVASSKQILARMLRNLKQIHIRQREFARALRAGERIVWLQPTEAGDCRDLGYLYYRTRAYHRALAAFERYLSLAGQPRDEEEIRNLIQHLSAQLGSLN